MPNSDEQKNSSPEKNNINEDQKEEFNRIQQGMQQCHAKLNGENLESLTLEDILNYLRGINHNFNALLRVMNNLSLRTIDIQTQMILLLTEMESSRNDLKSLVNINNLMDDVLNHTDELDNKKI